MFDEIYAGKNQPLWDHLKSEPTSANFSPLAHMELHSIDFAHNHPLSSLTIMQKCKPHYSFWSSITSFAWSHILLLLLIFLRFSLKLALSFSIFSYIILLPLHHSHLIGYSESSQPWRLEVVSRNVSHCIWAPILWAMNPQERKPFHLWRLKWAACTSLLHIAVFMLSNHWRHWDWTLLLGISNFYKWFIMQGSPAPDSFNSTFLSQVTNSFSSLCIWYCHYSGLFFMWNLKTQYILYNFLNLNLYILLPLCNYSTWTF